MHTSRLLAAVVLCAAVCMLLVGAYVAGANAADETSHPMKATGSPEMAVCVIHPLGDSKVEGKITFTQRDDGVEISAELTGLAPGEHGFHVHEYGDCSMADGTCAGDHFNPTGAPHGGPDSDQRHVGDFGNITADSAGKATYRRVDKVIALSGPQSIIGRAIIVHGGRDDLTSQPSGNSGARVGCGVIGIADSKMQH